jgi:hypothetical protein
MDNKYIKYKNKYSLIKNKINNKITELKKIVLNVNLINKNIDNKKFIIITGLYGIGKNFYSEKINKNNNFYIINYDNIIYDIYNLYNKKDITDIKVNSKILINDIYQSFLSIINKQEKSIIIQVSLKYLEILLNSYTFTNYLIILLELSDITTYKIYLTEKIKYDLINNSFSFASNFYNLINVEEIYKNNKLFYEDEYILNLITNEIINNSIDITHNKYQNPFEILNINI